ncbi:14570_t:CDS:2, partial [Funneliformis caledonium]
MESERSNSIAPQTPFTNEEDFFESDYRKPDPLFETNGNNLEPVARLSYLHSFHL